MTDENVDAEHRIAFKYNKNVNMMNKCSLVANKTSNRNMCVIIDQLSRKRVGIGTFDVH